MEINLDIYDKAKDIISANNKLQTYLQTCFRARICPNVEKMV